MSPLVDKKHDARKAIEDLRLEEHLAAAGAAAAKYAQQAVAAAGTFAADHRDQAHGLLGRAEGEADRLTGGRATDLLCKVRSGLVAGVDIVADQAPDAPAASGPAAGDAPSADDAPGAPPSSGV